MKKIRITESELKRLIQRIINEEGVVGSVPQDYSLESKGNKYQVNQGTKIEKKAFLDPFRKIEKKDEYILVDTSDKKNKIIYACESKFLKKLVVIPKQKDDYYVPTETTPKIENDKGLKQVMMGHC
jgi:hypothetical protein